MNIPTNARNGVCATIMALGLGPTAFVAKHWTAWTSATSNAAGYGVMWWLIISYFAVLATHIPCGVYLLQSLGAGKVKTRGFSYLLIGIAAVATIAPMLYLATLF